MTYESEDTTMGQIKDMLVENEGLVIELGELREEYAEEFNRHTATLSKLTQVAMERDGLKEDLAHEIEYARSLEVDADYWRESYDELARVHATKLDELNALQVENGWLISDAAMLATAVNSLGEENYALQKIRENLHQQIDWAVEDHLAAVEYGDQLEDKIVEIGTGVFDIFANAIAEGGSSEDFVWNLMEFTVDTFPALIPAINREWGLPDDLGGFA